MMSDEDHNPEQLLAREVVLTWVFGISLVGVLLFIVSIAK